ncbi:MAG: monovalent cation/H(+) antiporter subunit G [Anaerolineales bacterium]|jgi:multicomponent Na+:H+ antiporter subunit G
MENILIVIAIVAVCIGTFFSLTGVIGYIRFPDIYTRLHASAKVSVFGVLLLMVAAISWTPLSIGKGLILISLLLVTGPVISHTLASAAYRINIPRKQSQRDDLLQMYDQN